MKKNTLIKIFSVVLCLLMLVACGNESGGNGTNGNGGTKVAVWEGYEVMPFDEFLAEGYTAMMKDGGDDVTVESVTTTNGWAKSDDLDESDDLSSDCEAVTYVMKVSLGNEEVGFYFFMEQDSNGVLVCKGATAAYGAYSDEISGSGAYSELENLIPYVE